MENGAYICRPNHFHPKKGSGADARVGLLKWPLWYLMDECVKNYSAQ
jgi:hypothetical protein